MAAPTGSVAAAAAAGAGAQDGKKEVGGAGGTGGAVRDALRAVSETNTYKNPVDKDKTDFSEGTNSLPYPEKWRPEGQKTGCIVMATWEGIGGGARNQVLMQIRGWYPTVEAAQKEIDTNFYVHTPHATHEILDMWGWGWFPQTEQQRSSVSLKYHDPEIADNLKVLQERRQTDARELEKRREAAMAGSTLDQMSRSARRKLRQQQRQPVKVEKTTATVGQTDDTDAADADAGAAAGASAAGAGAGAGAAPVHNPATSFDGI